MVAVWKRCSDSTRADAGHKQALQPHPESSVLDYAIFEGGSSGVIVLPSMFLTNMIQLPRVLLTFNYRVPP